eukprot:TRINITY_DN1853_c0_g2_i1.p1 TRINITY_DN1853_c0_g2~~TRINITY_DN1853_c0_g2_i1.p1  ORF type:complete len:317 (-),score=11.78 TRINITY_DN1853_c0_g2_i1:57-887(-)
MTNLLKYPHTLTLSNLVATSFFSYICLLCINKVKVEHGEKIRDRPDSYQQMMKDLLPLGIIKALSLITLMYSLESIEVWYLQAVKALSPLYTVIFVKLFLGQVESLAVYSTLIPIMLGVGLCSTNQTNLSLYSLTIANICVLMDVVQNVYTKKLVSGRQYNKWSLQFYASIFALIIEIFVWFYAEGYVIIVSGFDPSKIGPINLMFFIIWIFSTISYYLQLMLAFSVMAEVTSLSYSVLNIVKRCETRYNYPYVLTHPWDSSCYARCYILQRAKDT